MKSYPKLSIALVATFLCTSCLGEPERATESNSISGLYEGPVGAIEFFADNTYNFTTRVSNFDGRYEFAGGRVTLYSSNETFINAFNVLPDGKLKSYDGHYSMKKVETPGEMMFKVEE